MYADITHENVDRVFQYIIPPQLEGKLKEGMEVLVPFGAGNREKKGYIVGFSEKCNYDSTKMKVIHDISDTEDRGKACGAGRLDKGKLWGNDDTGIENRSSG